MQNDPLDPTEPLARTPASTRTVLAQVRAGQLLASGQTAIKPGYRGPDAVGLFGPERPALAGAPPAGRLSAFPGRAV
jgi:hypothetical protein